MAPHLIPTEGHVVGLVDLGTNSVRLLVVRINTNRSYTILNQHKVMVRLGEGEFVKQRLRQEAMERTILVLRRFADMARNLGAEEIYAVATSATRDAENRDVFIERVRKEADIDLKVISGLEEARLIYLGVASGVHLGSRNALFIDIGGGSTELVVGNRSEYSYLDSLKLGCIRLSNIFFLPDEEAPVDDQRYALLQQFIRNASLRSVQRLKESDFDLVLGSSGTIETLAEVAQRAAGKGKRRDEEGDPVVTIDQIESAVRLIRTTPLSERCRIPGMDAERADVILPGAAILHTLMQDLELREIRVCSRSLKNGLLVDYLMRGTYGGYLEPEMSVREQSVLQLGRSCGFDEEHSRHIADLCLGLFDSAALLGLHALGAQERELLYYAALLHDVGLFLSFSNHQAHSFYIIRNVELLGFHAREIATIASAAFYHRKRGPKKTDPEFAPLDAASAKTVRVLSMFLRMAESMDRSHQHFVERVEFRRKGNVLLLDIRGVSGCQLEIWSLEEHIKPFSKLFGERFAIRVDPQDRPVPA